MTYSLLFFSITHCCHCQSWSSDAPDSSKHPESFGSLNKTSRTSFTGQQTWVFLLYWLCPQHWWWLDILSRTFLSWTLPQQSCVSLLKATRGKIGMILHHIDVRQTTYCTKQKIIYITLPVPQHLVFISAFLATTVDPQQNAFDWL